MHAAVRLAIMFLAAAPAIAQQDIEPLTDEETEEAVEPIRRYTVELIIFAYGESVATGNEIWMPEEPAIESNDDSGREDYFDEFDEALTEIDVPAIGRRYMDPKLVLFGEDDYTMTEIYEKLVELEAYEPLVRAGWTQPTFEKELTGPIALESLVESPPWLNGSLTLYLGRYLHLVVDLTMDSDRSRYPEPESDAEATTSGVLSFGDARVQAEYQLRDEFGELLPPPIRYRIFEDRIVKNGDIRYFDHPKFGVLAKITRFEEPEEEDFIDDTDDLLPGGQLSP